MKMATVGWIKQWCLNFPVRANSDGPSMVAQKPTTLSMHPDDGNKHFLLAYEPPQFFLVLLSTFSVTHSSHVSVFSLLFFCFVRFPTMLIHTPVSTSPLPDNDKNHCHYNGKARRRVTAHRAVHGLVRAQIEFATSTRVLYFEGVFQPMSHRFMMF